MNEITIRLTDNEYRDYVKKGQSMYAKRMSKKDNKSRIYKMGVPTW